MCQIWFRYLSRKKVAFTGAKEGSTIAIENMKIQRDLQSGETHKHSTLTLKKEKDDVTQGEKDIEQTDRLDLDEGNIILRSFFHIQCIKFTIASYLKQNLLSSIEQSSLINLKANFQSAEFSERAEF